MFLNCSFYVSSKQLIVRIRRGKGLIFSMRDKQNMGLERNIEEKSKKGRDKSKKERDTSL